MPNRTVNLLAIDPGTREMGFACFENDDLVDYGVKAIRQGKSPKDQLLHVEQIIVRIIREKRPNIIIIEKNNFSQIRQNVRLTLAVSQIKAIARKKRIRAIEYSPRTIRKVICNDGNATKREVARTIATLYPEMKVFLESNRRWRERYYQNSFDAIACGLAHIRLNPDSVKKPKIKWLPK